MEGPAIVTQTFSLGNCQWKVFENRSAFAGIYDQKSSVLFFKTVCARVCVYI